MTAMWQRLWPAQVIAMPEFVDMTGKPRARHDVEAALRFIEHEMVHNPMARASDGTPVLIHYMTIRDALRAYLAVLPIGGAK